jgi:hypothetical protein
MLLRTKKKGVSVLIGYVLLIVAALVMSGLVYTWMRSYIPKETLECPDGISLEIRNYTCENGILNITLRNSGRFNLDGYLIRSSIDESRTVETKEMAEFLVEGLEDRKVLNTIIFSGDRILNPQDSKTDTFDFSDADFNEIYSIKITPVKYQEVDNKKKFVSCADSFVREIIECN